MSAGSHKITRRSAIATFSSYGVVSAVVSAPGQASALQVAGDIRQDHAAATAHYEPVPGFSFPAPSDVGLYLQRFSAL